MSSEGDEQRLLEGLAVYAVAVVEMGATENEFRSNLGRKIGELGFDADDALGVVEGTAAAIARLPQPLDEAAEDAARREVVQEIMFENPPPSPADELAATLKTREWLERLAEDVREPPCP